MSENPTACDWMAARGDKWGAQVSGLEAMLAPVDAPLIRALQLAGACRVAEIGCGGGGTALAVLRQAAPGAVVHAFDVSARLVELARQRVPVGESRLTFGLADMASAAPADAPYDRLLSRFGIMFFEHPQAAFANLARWLAPGGRLAFAVWAPAADNPWVTAVRDLVAEIVELPAVPPDAPGAFRYADAGPLLASLQQAGFVDLDVRDWRGPLAIGGGLPPAQAAHFALEAFASFAEALAQAGGDARDRAQRAVTDLFTGHQRDGAVRLDARVHLVTGMR